VTQEKLVTEFDKWWMNDADHTVTGNLTRSMWAANYAWKGAIQKAADIAESHPLWTGEYIAAEIRKLMD
jgi:hypothetical protein